MRTKFLLSLAVILTQAFSVIAQTSKGSSTSDAFSLFYNYKGVSPAARFSRTANGNFNVLSAPNAFALANQFAAKNSAAACSDLNAAGLAAPEAAACNGVSVTPINFSNASRTVESGTNLNEGVVYRYSNVGAAPDGTVLDALVTVVDYNNNQDATPTTFRDADTTSVGFDGNLQPSIQQESNTNPNNTVWTGSIEYKIQFVRTGTTTPKVISVAATTIDNDGSTACGGLRESVTYSTALNQVLTTPAGVTTQETVGNKVTGPATVQAGIGVGNNFANAALYVNVSEFRWTYSFATTGACTANGASEDRFGSLNMSCQVNFGRNFASVPVGGSVFNDTNGLIDGIVSGVGTNAGGLFANLLDANGNVVSSVTVAADGTYSFPIVVAGVYNIQISANAGVESSPAPALVLPSGWVSTGENLGTAAGSDGSVNGLLPVTVGSTALTNANFGIEQRPVANSVTTASRTNPGGTTSVSVPATTFSASDLSTGTVSNIRITAFPTNATSITIGGTPYTAANFPSGGVTVQSNTSGNPVPAILVDPINGAVTVAIPFVAIDNANVESASAGAANVPFTVLAPTAGEVTIGGRVVTANGRGISRARVYLTGASGGTRYALTNPFGIYRFAYVAAGENLAVGVRDKRYTFDAPTQIFSANEDRADINFVGRLANRGEDTKPENSSRAPFDFDGDNRTDVAVYRPSNQTWYILLSATGTLRVEQFAADAGAQIAPADYDGDDIADMAVYNNESKVWTVLNSSNGEMQSIVGFGAQNEATPVAADYDGDGKADFALESNGELEIKQSSNGETVRQTPEPVVRENRAEIENGGVIILRGDFDGDGQIDDATFDKGLWNISTSGDSQANRISFGLEGDIPVPSAFLPKAGNSKKENR